LAELTGDGEPAYGFLTGRSDGLGLRNFDDDWKTGRFKAGGTRLSSNGGPWQVELNAGRRNLEVLGYCSLPERHRTRPL
jgi:hypothetical protein